MNDDLMARLEALVSGLEQTARESERERVAADAQRAEAARNGELGADWQRVQRRIDMGETSVADVFSGRDESPEARRLVQTSQETLTRIAAEEPPDDVAADLAALEAQKDRFEGVRPRATPRTPPIPPEEPT